MPMVSLIPDDSFAESNRRFRT